MTTWTIHHLDRRAGELYRLRAVRGPIVAELKCPRRNRNGVEMWHGRIKHKDRDSIRHRTESLHEGPGMALDVLLRRLQHSFECNRAATLASSIDEAIDAIWCTDWKGAA